LKPTEEQANKRLENFKGKQHFLTDADRSLGGRSYSKKRHVANILNPISSGKFVKKISGDFLVCNSCSFRRSCAGYKQDAKCSVISTETFKEFGALVSGSPQDYLKKILQTLTNYEVSGKLDGNPVHQRDLAALLMKLLELKVRVDPAPIPPEQQTVLVYERPAWLKVCKCGGFIPEKKQESEPVSPTDSSPKFVAVSGSVIEERKEIKSN